MVDLRPVVQDTWIMNLSVYFEGHARKLDAIPDATDLITRLECADRPQATFELRRVFDHL